MPRIFTRGAAFALLMGAALGDSYHDMLLMDWTVFQAGIDAQGASIRDFRTPDGGYGSANGDLTQLMIQRNGRTVKGLVDVGREQDAARVAIEIVRSKGADRALAERLEQGRAAALTGDTELARATARMFPAMGSVDDPADDNDNDPTNAPPANSDNPDGLTGTIGTQDSRKMDVVGYVDTSGGRIYSAGELHEMGLVDLLADAVLAPEHAARGPQRGQPVPKCIEALRSAIATGALSAGARLPSARTLSAQLGVARGADEAEDGGLPGRGSTLISRACARSGPPAPGSSGASSTPLR